MVFCDAPNDLLYRFEGHFIPWGFDSSLDEVDISYSQFLLRGAVVKNTDWVIGMIVYTGHETKIIKNSLMSRLKFSKLENLLNWLLFGLCLLMVLLCGFFAFAGRSWNVMMIGKADYLQITF